MENRQCKEPYRADLLMRYQKGDVVRLAGSVMLAEFGLMLCDDDGVGVEIDGVLLDVKPDMVNVIIRRMHPRPAPFAWQESSLARWVSFKRYWKLLKVNRTYDQMELV